MQSLMKRRATASFHRPAVERFAMITATYLVRKEDVLAMSMRYYANYPPMRKSRILIQAGVPIVMVLVVALSYLVDPDDLIFVAPLIVVAVLWAGFYPRLHERLVLLGLKRTFNGPEYQKIYGSHTLSLNEKGIASTSPTGEGTSFWSSVSGISLTSDYLFIFLAGRQGIVVPRAQVEEATIQEMKAFAEQMMKTSATTAPAAQTSSSRSAEGGLRSELINYEPPSEISADPGECGQTRAGSC